ncbi:uncharacterized protein VP01_6142g1, partial [Puccinia sorghi]
SCLNVFEKTVYTPFLFTEQSSKEFDALKKAFTTAPILAIFIAGVISQYYSLNLLHPWFQILYHVETTFTPERGRPLPITTIMFELFFPPNSVQFKKIVVPDNSSLKLSILKSRHDSPLAGHFGKEKTYSLISQDFSWPAMTRDNQKYGLLQPLPIPPLPWHSFSMDFISQLPLSNGYDDILVIVDCFLKMSLFIQTKTTCTSLE